MWRLHAPTPSHHRSAPPAIGYRPPGPDTDMKLTRRSVAKFSAGSAMGLGLSGLSLRTLGDVSAAVSPEVYPPRGQESFSNSICQLCPGGCGVTVRKIGTRAVRIAGNKNSPVNT